MVLPFDYKMFWKALHTAHITPAIYSNDNFEIKPLKCNLTIYEEQLSFLAFFNFDKKLKKFQIKISLVSDKRGKAEISDQYQSKYYRNYPNEYYFPLLIYCIQFKDFIMKNHSKENPMVKVIFTLNENINTPSDVFYPDVWYPILWCNSGMTLPSKLYNI